MALLVSALSNSTDFTPKEDLVYDQIVANHAVKEGLREDASVIIKDFLVLTRLRKKQIEHRRRTRLVMGLIVHASRFNTKRL
jgi:hypothetical protein